MILLGQTLREHIGGRWAVSLPLFAVYVPLGIVATIGNLSTTTPGTTLGQLLVASTLSLVPLALLLWISDLTWLRRRRIHPVPILAVIALGGAIGVVRSASMYALSVGMGIQDPDAALAWTRTIAGGVQGATAYPLGVLAISLIASYREQRRILMARQIAWESRRLQDARAWEEIREEVIAPIETELAALGDDLDRKVISIDAAASSVRDRAHHLWGDAQPASVVPRVRVVSTMIASLRVRPFATWLILALWVPTALGTTLAVGPIPRAPLGALVSGALLLAIFEAANAITVRNPGLWWVVLPVGLILAVVVTSPATGLFGRPASQATGEFTAVNAIWLTLLTIVSAIIVSALRRGEDIIDELHASVDAASVATLAQEDERRRVIHHVASTLHGTLQGRLASLPRDESPGAAVRETLALLRVGATMQAGMTLAEIAEATLEPWLPLVQITTECTDATVSTSSRDGTVSAPLAQLVADALEECTSNAFRHGRARHVHCQLLRTADAIRITVSDDGEGPHLEQGPPGLGSRILDRCGDWTRSYSSAGTTVRIVIATSDNGTA